MNNNTDHRGQIKKKSRHSDRIKYSSPFSSSTQATKTAAKSTAQIKGNNAENDKNQQAASSSPTTLSINTMNEQIIGLEFVCIIGSNTVTHNLDDLEERRTRTTTLTPETEGQDTQPTKTTDTSEHVTTNLTDNASLIETNVNVNPSRVSTAIDNANVNAVANFMIPHHMKKKIFYSKFRKLNLSCLLDLIDDKDLEEFKQLVDKLDLVDHTDSSSASISTNDVKVYLRFNWYSFSELNINTHASVSSILTNATGSYLNSNSISKMFPSAGLGNAHIY